MEKRPSKITIDNEEQSSSIFLPFFSIIALGLFLTLCWYAYNYYLEQQKPDGVYYIKADKSPFKVKPENPGGLVVENQDKQIFNAMVGDTENLDGQINTVEGEEPADKEEIADVIKISAESEDYKDNNTDLSEEEAKIALPGSEEEKSETKQVKVVEKEALKAVPKKEEEKQKVQKAKTEELKKEAPKEYIEVKEKDEETGVNKTTVTLKVPEKSEPTKPTPKSMASVATSSKGKSFYVQISSHKTMADLESGWKRFSAKFKSVYSGSSRNVNEATVNGAKYYRLSFGPYSDRNAAISKCQALKSQKQDCIVQAY